MDLKKYVKQKRNYSDRKEKCKKFCFLDSATIPLLPILRLLLLPILRLPQTPFFFTSTRSLV
jgi:hypothetical protein